MAAAVESVMVVHNVGTLARSVTAFGVAEVIVVARRDVSSFGSHGSTSHLRFSHFASLALARAYLKDERGCDICGVEITDEGLPVTTHPFRRSTAFLFGNEGTGLSQKECEICDFFHLHPSVWWWKELHHSMLQLQHQLFSSTLGELCHVLKTEEVWYSTETIQSGTVRISDFSVLN